MLRFADPVVALEDGFSTAAVTVLFNVGSVEDAVVASLCRPRRFPTPKHPNADNLAGMLGSAVRQFLTPDARLVPLSYRRTGYGFL